MIRRKPVPDTDPMRVVPAELFDDDSTTEEAVAYDSAVTNVVIRLAFRPTESATTTTHRRIASGTRAPQPSFQRSGGDPEFLDERPTTRFR